MPHLPQNLSFPSTHAIADEYNRKARYSHRQTGALVSLFLLPNVYYSSAADIKKKIPNPLIFLPDCAIIMGLRARSSVG